MQQITVKFTDAQIKAFPTANPTIIPAQGANTVIIPVSAYMRLIWFANYTNITASAGLRLEATDSNTFMGSLFEGNVAGSKVSELLAAGGDADVIFLNTQSQVTGGFNIAVVTGSFFNGAPLGANLPQNLNVGNGAGGNFTGGDPRNVFVVSVIFFTVNLT